MGASDAELVDQLQEQLSQAATRLSEVGAPTEALATVEQPRRILFITREPKLVAVGRVWHLGVFLLASDATLYQVGSTTRAVEPGRPNYQSISGENRRAQRAAAFRAGFTPGESVNIDATPIELDAAVLRGSHGRLFLHEGRALVRWHASADVGSSIEFGAYLRERVELLVEPPAEA